MKNFIVHLVFIQLFLLPFLQIRAQPLTWDNVYSFPGKYHGIFTKVLRTGNNEMYLAGYAEFGWCQYSPGFMRIDTNGNALWTHSYDFPDSYQQFTHTLVKLNENSYYSFCFNPLIPVPVDKKKNSKWEEITNDCWLLKLNDNGDTVFAKHYENIGWVNDLIIDNGNLIAVGSTNYYEEDSLMKYYTKATLLALDTNGTFLWKKEYLTDQNARVNSILKNPAGNYLITGTTTDYFDSFGYIMYPDKMFFFEVDTMGNLLSEYFSDIEYSEGKKIIICEDGNYAIIGDGYNPENNTIDIILWKFDTANTLLNSVFSALPKEDKAYSFDQTPDGGFIICGSIIPLSSTGGAYAFFYFKTNESGVEEWYTNNHQNFSFASDVLINDHSGYFIVGKGSNAKIVKSDLNGNGLITSIREDLDFSNDKLFEIYPNPVQTKLLFIKHASSVYCEVSIFNLLGRLITRQKTENGGSVNINGLEKGVYILSVTDETDHIVTKEKIIVE
ncbi:MAG: T9SS type A sorting domain-containing protein [Bacteroidales bacterium]|jgi:hypothetical protein